MYTVRDGGGVEASTQYSNTITACNICAQDFCFERTPDLGYESLFGVAVSFSMTKHSTARGGYVGDPVCDEKNQCEPVSLLRSAS